MLPKLAPHLVGPLALLAAGLGWQALLPRPLERSTAARAGLGYLIGAAWVALSAWMLGELADARLTRGLFVGLAVAPALAGAIATIRRRGATPAPHFRRRHGWAAWVAAAFGALVTLALLADAVTDPVRDFDGRMTWGTTARYLAADARTTPATLADEAAFVVHPRYPIVLPLLRVAAVELSGRGFSSYSERPLYALFLPALLLALWPTLTRRFGRPASLLAVVLVGSAPVLLWGFETGARSTYSDLPLASFLGGAFAVWLHPATRRGAGRGALAGLLLAAAAASKNEGLLIAPLTLVALVVISGRRWRRAGLSATLPVASVLVLVLHWRSGIPNRNDEAYFETLELGDLLDGLLHRAPRDLLRGLGRSFDRGLWGALFWWLAAALPLLVAARRSRAVRVASAAIGLQVFLVACSYAVAPGDVVAATWERFVLQQSASWMILVAAAARQALRWAAPGRASLEGERPFRGAPIDSTIRSSRHH